MVSPLDRRLIFVTGKGGVGKTTIAHALGRLAARDGRRVIIAELAAGSARTGITEAPLTPGLFSIVIEPQAAMEEYLRVKAGGLGGRLASSKLFGTLATATPGLREMLGMGKIWELAQLERRTRGGGAYDLVIVDAPATGHGVAALRTPRVFAETARVGPIAQQAATIAATIADPSFTAVIAVSLAEEMPVRETLSLADSLRADGLELDRVVLNARAPDRFTPEEVAQIGSALDRIGGAGTSTDPNVAAALAAARSAQRRADAQRPHVDRLRERFGERLISLPRLFAADLGEPELVELSDGLAAALGLAATVEPR